MRLKMNLADSAVETEGLTKGNSVMIWTLLQTMGVHLPARLTKAGIAQLLTLQLAISAEILKLKILMKNVTMEMQLALMDVAPPVWLK